MGENASLFWIFFDLLALTPLIFLVRLLLPHAQVMRGLFIGIGLYAYYLIGPRFVVFFVTYWYAVCLLQFLLAASDRRGAPVRVAAATSAIMAALAPMVWWKIDPAQFTISANQWSSQLLWKLFPH